MHTSVEKALCIFFDVLAKSRLAALFRNEKGLLHPFGMEHAFLVDTFIGVRTEVIALRLDQVRRQHRGAVAVVVGDRSRKVGVGIPFCTA